MNTFDYHVPTNEELQRIIMLREAYKELQTKIQFCCKPGRYRALAMTELEASAMWAIKSIVLEKE